MKQLSEALNKVKPTHYSAPVSQLMTAAERSGEETCIQSLSGHWERGLKHTHTPGAFAIIQLTHMDHNMEKTVITGLSKLCICERHCLLFVLYFIRNITT